MEWRFMMIDTSEHPTKKPTGITAFELFSLSTFGLYDKKFLMSFIWMLHVPILLNLDYSKTLSQTIYD